MKPINLNKARKRRARTEAKADADANAAKFGRSKAERTGEKVAFDKAAERLEAHRREKT